MTREERENAIRCMKLWIEREPYIQTYKTCLEALERYKDLQDYFSDKDIAKTVLENQTEFKAWLERLRWNTKKVDELARKLEELEPKQGHWIERIERDEYNDYEEEWFECDQCHIDAERPFNYCPNCGCRMSEVSE